MTVLIVENNKALAELWQRHLERQNLNVRIAANADAACDLLSRESVSVIVIDLDLEDGAALGVADFASYRQPEARAIFVTARSFFSDGSIFEISPNACGFLNTDAAPEDLAALVEHHSRATGDA